MPDTDTHQRLVDNDGGQSHSQQTQQQTQPQQHRVPLEDMQVNDELTPSASITAPPAPRTRSRSRSLNSEGKRADVGTTRLPMGIARRTLGIILLLIVVVMWTASSFLGSTILADNTYSKPFFVTYLNTSFFLFPLLAIIGHRLFRLWRVGKLSKATSFRNLLTLLDSHEATDESRPFLAVDDDGNMGGEASGQRGRYQRVRADDDEIAVGDEDNIERVDAASERLGFRETAKLSLEFCLLWANYFALACLQFTTVGSTTILTSTSGVWTLIFGAMISVEKFTIRKLLGVLASLTGIFLISRVDLSGSNDEDRGSFPHKSITEIAVGDAMAAFSAILYGIYTVVMKKQVGNESRVNMLLFFGLVGFINTVLLWPVMIVLHYAGWETFELPGTGRVWVIIILNSVTSLISDILWAYAMLLTTPLVVTVGLSLTIPLSLIGQMILQGLHSSALYWVGAVIVFLSFMVVNHEGKRDEDDEK
ncbi:hypothetical protein AJ79_08350 [Helicocarpus griseus UAMH5409]|uniref:DUF3955 domain-containing protein n=1 Tax=Helicocarpus griseus UAMH5409 TaxID=1447875 RepID=A0A2B7WTQ3_9EURO|nr:hypothetical protein AJ79_08350 [Helicocarpus griseus UAMH5409]